MSKRVVSGQLAGTGFVLLAASLYALLPILARLAYRAGMEPFDVLAWRFFVASGLVILAAPWWWRRANLTALSRRDVTTLMGLGALFAFVALMAFIGLANVPAPIFSPIFYTYPAMTALLGAALGDRLPRIGWVAVCLAVAGCAVSALSADPAAQDFNPANLIYPLITAASYAVYLNIAGQRTAHIPGLASAVMSIAGSLAILIVASLGLGLASTLGVAGVTPLHVPASPAAYLSIAGIALFSTVFTILLMFLGIARIGPARAAIFSTLEPLVVIILSAIILGETVGPAQLLGGAMILASVVMLNFNRAEPAA